MEKGTTEKKPAKLQYGLEYGKNNALPTAASVVGFMLGHAASQKIPMENPLIKGGIVTGVGTAMLFTNNKWATAIGAGMATAGVLFLLDNVIRGKRVQDEQVVEGIGNIGSNETVAKIADLFIPRLGNVATEIYSTPQVVDLDYDYQDVTNTQQKETFANLGNPFAKLGSGASGVGMVEDMYAA